MKRAQGGYVRLTGLLLLVSAAAQAEGPAAQKSAPVPVTFGIRALTPETPINPLVAFVSQGVTLPEVVCNACTDQDSWTREWTVSHMTLDRDNSRAEQGWYVFHGGLNGIDVSVQVAPLARKTQHGSGMQLKESGELTVGLVRTGRDTGAGLVDLPATEFIRTTTFTGPDGQVKYVQQDAIRVSADLRVPTCTTAAGSLSFQLLDISQVGLRRTVVPGGFTDESASLPQVVVANCSENTRHLRIRFIPQGAVTDSQQGPATILVGKDENGQETGTGFLMKYDASAFGRTQQGVVQWDRNQPLVLENPSPSDAGNELTQGITVALQAFYARPLNDKAITAGQVIAKGLYQVSYD
ncbi:hypothetical protein [Serratia marcescens]|uniref:hypothetical protein n=1 Tax=Serratia marcescens TaxID=615 RepID=UPI000E0178BB|nr:hypothetical protein [Serratia marcescens]SUJ36010.1 Uncharacterised protein [Serratia marcescens]